MNLMNRKSKRSNDSPADARTYALKLLSYRSRSKKEMTEKLRLRGFPAEHIEGTLAFLENTGLINDESLAADLFRHSIEYKFLGRQGIKVFLLKRGIDRQLVETTLAAHSKEREEQAAREFAERKMKVFRNYPDAVAKRRLSGMLQRRGFSGSTIMSTLHSLSTLK